VAVSGLCVDGCPLPPLRDGASLELKSETCCDLKNRRKMYTAWANPIEGCWVPVVHANCMHNELAALLMRSLGPTPGCAESARAPVKNVFARLRLVSRRYGQSRWTHRDTALSYTGALRRRYLEAEDSLTHDGPISSRDVMLRAFLKAEKCNALAKFPKPRMIFPRSPRYNLELATWLKPFEHWLWGNLTSRRLFGGSNTRVSAKGLNPRQRANLIVRKFRSLPSCVVFEVDGKAFEAHCDAWQLQLEHSVYEAAYPGDRDLQRMLAKQLVNFGVTANGVRFSREGGRASGDFNTGMGNTLIMSAVVVAVLRELKVPFDVLVDGDNALVFLRQCDSSRVCRVFAQEVLKVSGHEMVLERPVSFIEGVRFGQSAPVLTQRGWTMVRDFRKVLSQGTSNHAHLHDPRFVAPFLHGVALCELSLNAGVPILGVWAEKLRKATVGGRAVDAAIHRDYQALGVRTELLREDMFEVASDCARQSFSRAFGVAPETQVLLEEMLTVPSFGSPWKLVDPPTRANWFFAEPGLVEGYFSGGLIQGE